MCVALNAASPVRAQQPDFGDLLAKAKAQAAAGHRWSPAGDNMTETIMTMMDLVPTATSAQLAELSALLEANPSPSAAAPADDHPAGPAEAAPVAAPHVAEPPVSQKPAPIVANIPPHVAAPSVSQKPPPMVANIPSSSATPPVSQKPPPMVANIPPSSAEPLFPGPPVSRRAVPNPAQPRPAESGQPVTNPTPRAALLFARGLDAEHRGDFSAARRFYDSSAELGDGAAARNLGRLYDPAYLRQTALGGIDPDPALARHWYERAVSLGDAQAGPLLEALSVR